jgi:hypothetical protein
MVVENTNQNQLTRTYLIIERTYKKGTYTNIKMKNINFVRVF